MSELKENKPGPEYAHLLAEVKERVRSAQYAALKAVNTELVGLYWDIGQMIVERQRDAKHGTAIAEQLSNDLRTAFPGNAYSGANCPRIPEQNDQRFRSKLPTDSGAK